MKLAAVIFIVTSLLFQTGPANATYLEEYQKSITALDAGDRAAAVQHAEAAWRMAEQIRGVHPDTADLAYLAGRLTVFSNPKIAIAAFTRAEEVYRKFPDGAPVNEVIMMLAYSEFSLSDRKRASANKLRKALEELEGTQAANSFDAAMIWLNLSTSDLGQRRFRHAEKSSAKAVEKFAALEGDVYQAQAEALLNQALAVLLPRNRDLDDVEYAYAKMMEAERLFPPQENIETFDRTLGKIIAWGAATAAARGNLGRDEFRTEIDLGSMPPLFKKRTGNSKNCDLEWESREPPEWPPEVLNTLGGVVIGYHLDAEGRVTDARIVAEAPDDQFGETALEAVKTWRLAKPPKQENACMRNILSQFSFTARQTCTERNKAGECR